MLYTGGEIDLGDASYSSLFAIERSFRLYAVERRGMVWDSRFIRAREQIAPDRCVLYFLLDGWVRVRGAVGRFIEGPGAFVTTQSAIEGLAEDAGFSLVSGGEPLRTLQMTVAASDLLIPCSGAITPIAVSGDTLEAARRVVGAHDVHPGPAIAAFLDSCAADSILRPGLAATIVPEEPTRITRVWNALSASTNPRALGSHQGIGEHAGVSPRQVSRMVEEIKESFGLDWRGWRVVTNDLRLRFAVLLLSVNSLSIADVAVSSGYGSTNALALAFRRAGLPAPSIVRLEIQRDEEPSLPLTAAAAR
jgi:AraC-like DNA-binding protein